MEYVVTRRQKNSASCFVCGLLNEMSLRARFYETTSNEVVALFTTLNEHQSYPGRLHGGVTAAILDETIGRAIFCYNDTDKEIWGVTIDIKVEYKRPVPLGCELKVVGRIVKNEGRIYEAEGELYLPNGKVAAVAYGRYMKQPYERIVVGGSKEDEEFGWDFPLDEVVPDTIKI